MASNIVAIQADPAFQKLSPADQQAVLFELLSPADQEAARRAMGAPQEAAPQSTGLSAPFSTNPLVKTSGDVMTGAGKQILDWLSRAAAMIPAGGEGGPTSPSLTPVGTDPSVERGLQDLGVRPPPAGMSAEPPMGENVGRFLTRMAPQMALGAATSGMPLLTQAGIQGVAQAGQTALEGGTGAETGLSGLFGAGAPAAVKVLGMLGPSVAGLKKGAAQTLAKLLNMDPGEAMHMALPLSDAPPTAAAKEAFVRGTANTLGVGRGSTLVERAVTDAEQKQTALQAMKDQLFQADEWTPTNTLRQAADATEQSIPRYNVPDLPPVMGQVTSPILNAQGQPITTQALVPQSGPKPPDSQNIGALSAVTERARRLRETADHWDKVTANTPRAGLMPIKDFLDLRTGLGDVASPAFNVAVTKEVANEAAAAKSAYIPITKDFHSRFPVSVLPDLNAHQSQTVADLIRMAATKGMLRESPSSAIALRTGVAAPLMMAADTTAAKALSHTIGGYASLAAAMEIIRMPAFRSLSLSGQLALADAIERGAFTAPTRALAAGAARATSDAFRSEPEP
jgi:hypothetical protein